MVITYIYEELIDPYTPVALRLSSTPRRPYGSS